MATPAAAGIQGGGGGEPGFEVGFRFRPTEVDLIDFYLRRRTQGDLTIPKCFIQELDVYERQPWHLPHHLFPYCNAEEKEMYFFTRRRRASGNSSKRFSRSVDEGGLWDGHAAGKSIYREKVEIGHRAQLAFKLFDGPGDKKNKRGTPWILHEYRLVDDKADDVVLCRIHKRKGKGEDGEGRVAPVVNTRRRFDERIPSPAVQPPPMEVDAVAADDVGDDADLLFAQLLEEELMEEEAEAEQGRVVKRQRIGGGDDEGARQIIPTSQQQLQSPVEKRCGESLRIEEGEAHQASAVDADDGLTMTLDEINSILGELPSDTPQQRSVDSVDMEQLWECLEAGPLASFDDLSFRLDGDMLQETLAPAGEDGSVKGGRRNHVSHSGLLEPAMAGFCCR